MTTTTTNNNQRIIRSPSLAKYIKNVQQANERTAEQYEYRLSKFEKYIIVAPSEEEGQQQQQQQNLELTTALDHVIYKLKSGNNNKIDPYDLLSGFVAYLQEEEGIENPNAIRYFIITARNFLEYNDIEISPRKFKLKVRLPS